MTEEIKPKSENWYIAHSEDGKPCAIANDHGKPTHCLITVEADFDDDDQMKLFFQWIVDKLNSK